MAIHSSAVRQLPAPSVSVVVLNFNGEQFLDECVNSLIDCDYANLEIIVVDNASTDDSLGLLKRQFGKIANVRLIGNSRNLGFAAGNNVGYSQSKGEIVVFLNVDTRVHPKWLKELVRVLNSDAAIGAAQCKLLSMDDPRKIDSLGGYLDTIGYAYSWGEWYSARPANITGEPFYAEGAAMAVRRSAAEQVLLDRTPFDSASFLFYDDSDLCWRLRLRGFRVVLAPLSIVYHHRGYETQKSPSRAVFHSAKNRISTLIKNYGFWNLLRWLPFLLVLEILRAISLMNHDSASALAKFRAAGWCVKNLGQLWRKRLYVQGAIRRVPDLQVTRDMLKPDFGTLFGSTAYRER